MKMEPDEVLVFIAKTTNGPDNAEDSLGKSLDSRCSDHPFATLTRYRSEHYPEESVLPSNYWYLLVRSDGRLSETSCLPSKSEIVAIGNGDIDLADIVDEARKIASERNFRGVFVTPYRFRGNEFGKEYLGYFINSTVKEGGHINYHGSPYCFENSQIMFELVDEIITHSGELIRPDFEEIEKYTFDKRIILDVFGERETVELPDDYPEGELEKALWRISNKQYRVQSPNTNIEYEFSGSDVIDLLKRNLLFVVDESRGTVGLNYLPPDQSIIKIYIPTNEEFHQSCEATANMQTVANQFGELITLREYSVLRPLLKQKDLVLWKTRLEDAYRLLTEEERKSLYKKSEIKPVDFYIQEHLNNQNNQ